MFRSTTFIRELQCPCRSRYYLNHSCMYIKLMDIMYIKNTHTWDAHQAKIDPNNMICCHTTKLNIHTTVV